jgi:recombination protein RecR
VNLIPEEIKKVIEFFSKLPGVGEKTALRQTLILTHWDQKRILDFGDALKKLAEIKKCQQCGMFAESQSELCSICSDDQRLRAKTLCVVENITDCMAIEKSGSFHGLFHVLGGVLNPLMGIGPDELNLDKLKSRVESLNVENVILAINPSVEGDATCNYLKQIFPATTKVERIGFGIPMGGSLEYLDSLTIFKALENRKTF